MDAWFPRLSPSGTQLAYGSRATTIIVPNRPTVVVPNASGPKWLTEDIVLMAQNTPGQPGDGQILQYAVGDPSSHVTTYAPPGYVSWDCGNARFIGARAGDPYAPQVSPGGHIAAGVDLGNSTSLRLDGQEIDQGGLFDWRWSALDDMLMWTKVVGAVRQIWLWRDGTIRACALVADDEYQPIPVILPNGGAYVLTHTNDLRCLFRPWDSTVGHLVCAGVTDNPDAVALSDTTIQTVWSASGNAGSCAVQLPGELRQVST
jgi:hypothetical protein